jgi:hypothetical protein
MLPIPLNGLAVKDFTRASNMDFTLDPTGHTNRDFCVTWAQLPILGHLL